MKRLHYSFFVAVFVTTLLVSSATAAGRGTKAQVWLEARTRFSGFSLPPGQYLFQHTLNDAEHSMSFIQLRSGNSVFSTSAHKVMPVRVRCKLVPLQEKASRTAFYYVAEDGLNRATRLEIKGEKVAHIFPGPVAPRPVQ